VQSFTKAERISIQREIDLLFSEGTSFATYPLRVVYVEKMPFSGVPVSVLISVPKKRFKRAVKRNRIKRLIRETYRLNKGTLIESLHLSGKGLLIAFVYVGNEICDFSTLNASMKKIIAQFAWKPF